MTNGGDLQFLIAILGGLQPIQYTNAAATTIYLYEIMLTLDLEKEYIWSRFSFTLSTMLYIINRYVGLVFFLFNTYKLAGFHGDFSDTFCQMPIEFIGTLIVNASWAGILTLRVRALWLHNRMVVWSIYILAFGLLGTYLVVHSITNVAMLATMRYISPFRGCVPTILPQAMRIVSVAPVLYNVYLTILMLIKAFEFAAPPVKQPLPLLFRVLMQDGVAYFVLSTILYIVNMIYWSTAADSKVILILGLYIAIVSSFIARLVLNLKVAHHRSLHEQRLTEDVSANVTDLFGERVSNLQYGTTTEEGEPLEDTLPTLAKVELEDEGQDPRGFNRSQDKSAIPMKPLDIQQRATRADDA